MATSKDECHVYKVPEGESQSKGKVVTLVRGCHDLSHKVQYLGGSCWKEVSRLQGGSDRAHGLSPRSGLQMRREGEIIMNSEGEAVCSSDWWGASIFVDYND